MNEQNQIRDAVIKLEVKMESMSDSMASMADAVTKLVDMRVEMAAIKKDVNVLSTEIEKQRIELINMYKQQRNLEKIQDKNTYVIGKIEVFWTALVTGAAAFLWWLAKA